MPYQLHIRKRAPNDEEKEKWREGFRPPYAGMSRQDFHRLVAALPNTYVWYPPHTATPWLRCPVPGMGLRDYIALVDRLRATHFPGVSRYDFIQLCEEEKDWFLGAVIAETLL